ncbi:hypothetical protein [Pectinatus frisingensis]|uniref:hypothetical protein n=1 Tax=Pectinatus frisingensis TaxID=865 RepID=UPI0018C465E8|nr:hypothetical protein [Pectinatus frisingensis]
MEKIIFIASYPNKKNEKDGMYQRIKAVDQSFSNIQRRYIEISFTKYLNRKVEKRNKIVIEKINFFVGFFYILNVLCQAKYIYVHTMGNALRVFPIYFFHKNIITDVHGILPEEIKYYSTRNYIDKSCRVIVYTFIEWIILRYSRYVVVVSKVMKTHFNKKYKVRSNLIVIPIFDLMEPLQNMLKKDKNVYIYAGGVHKWQNIDKMLSVIKLLLVKKPGTKVTILTNRIQYFREKMMQKKIPMEYIELDCVKKEDLINYYECAMFGFVLRDDNPVNRVACPTKLVEYMNYGVIPIVSNPFLGDFFDYGYRYVEIENILNTNNINFTTIINRNWEVIKMLNDEALKNMDFLVKLIG